MPIEHKPQSGAHFDKYSAWADGDLHLDWYGAELGQGDYMGEWQIAEDSYNDTLSNEICSFCYFCLHANQAHFCTSIIFDEPRHVRCECMTNTCTQVLRAAVRRCSGRRTTRRTRDTSRTTSESITQSCPYMINTTHQFMQTQTGFFNM